MSTFIFFALASYQRRHLMLTAGRLFFYYRCLFHSFIHNLPTSGWMAVDSHSDFHMNDLNDCIWSLLTEKSLLLMEPTLGSIKSQSQSFMSVCKNWKTNLTLKQQICEGKDTTLSDQSCLCSGCTSMCLMCFNLPTCASDFKNYNLTWCIISNSILILLSSHYAKSNLLWSELLEKKLTCCLWWFWDDGCWLKKAYWDSCCSRFMALMAAWGGGGVQGAQQQYKEFALILYYILYI